MAPRKKAAKPSTNGHGPTVTLEEVQQLKDQFLVEDFIPLDDESDGITVRVNPTVAYRAEETFRVLSAKRRLKQTDKINGQDSEVLALMEAENEDDPDFTALMWRWRSGNMKGQRDRKKIAALVSQAVDRVRAKYESHEARLRALIYFYTLIADDVYTIEKKAGQIAVQSRLDYGVPDEYWEHGGDNIRDADMSQLGIEADPLVDVLETDVVEEFKPHVDRGSAAEMMLGMTFELLRQNPKLARELMRYSMHLAGYLEVYDRDAKALRELDRKSFRDYQTRLAAVVYERDGGADSDDEQPDVVVRVSNTDAEPEPTGEQEQLAGEALQA